MTEIYAPAGVFTRCTVSNRTHSPMVFGVFEIASLQNLEIRKIQKNGQKNGQNPPSPFKHPSAPCGLPGQRVWGPRCTRLPRPIFPAVCIMEDGQAPPGRREAALYLNTMLQQHVLQGGQAITQEAFVDLQRRSTHGFVWLYDWPEDSAASGTWTHYNVVCIPSAAVVAVHASSSRRDEWGDSFAIPSSATARRFLPRAEGVFHSMLQLKDEAEQQQQHAKQTCALPAVGGAVHDWR